MLDEQIARRQVVECCRRMHERRLISGGEGNVSVRLGRSRILVTPSGVNKGFMDPSDLVVIDLDGKRIKGGNAPTSEVPLHISAYRARPDVSAVVHAHPPYTIAFTIAGMSLAQCIIPESILALGEVPVARYATPSTRELAMEVERLLVDHDVVVMDRHGSVTLGKDVFEAYDRLESLEHTAMITYCARVLGPVHPLPEEEIARLRDMAEAMGRKTSFKSCDGCNVCDGRDFRLASDDEIVQAVTQAVLDAVAEKAS